jgi:gliding motility-associated-like protein
MASYEPTLITLTSSTTNITCFGAANGTAAITATGGTGTGYSYLWDDPLGQATATATGLTAGTYTCLVTDGNGCSQSTSVNITEPALVTTGVVLTHSTCFGANDGYSEVFPTGVTGASFSVLYNSISYGATSLFPLVPGFYSVQVINTITGCPSAIELIEILEPNALTATTSAIDVACNGDLTGQITVTATGGNAPYTYSLIDASGATLTSNNTGNFIALAAGDYTCEIIDANSCPAFTTSLITILEPAVIVANMTITDVSCNGISPPDGGVTVNPTGGTGNYTYTWSHDIANTTNTSLGYAAATGIYSVSITDIAGCTQVFPFNITQPAVFTTSAIVISNYNGSDISCNGLSDGEIEIIPVGGVAIDYYNINGIILSSGNTQGSLSANTYFIDAYDINGCYSSCSVVVNEPASILANQVITNISCNGLNDGSVVLAPSGGTSVSGLYTVNWINFATVPTIPSSYHGYSTLPLYPLNVLTGATVEVVDDNNCTISFPVNITEEPVLVSSLTYTPTTCNNLDNGLGSSADGTATASVAGGTFPYTYSWNTTPVQTLSTATGLMAGTYECIVTDANGCTDTQSIAVTSPDPLGAGLTTTAVSCIGLSDGSATVSPTGFQGIYNINWSNGSSTNTISALSTYNPSAPLMVTVTDMSANNCGFVSDMVVVGTPTSPVTASYILQEPTCNGDANGQATLVPSGGTSPYTYDWPAFGIYNSVDIYSPSLLAAGNYNVTVTDDNGCSNNLVVTMTEPLEVTVNITIASHISCNLLAQGTTGSDGVLQAVVTGGVPFPGPSYNYTWTNSSGTLLGVLSSQGGLPEDTYQVVATDANGCSGHTTELIIAPPAIVFNFVSPDYNGYHITCFGANDGSLTGNVTGGSNGVDMSTYVWTPGLATSTTINSLSPGPYVLTVEDNDGCEFIETFTIYEPLLLTSSTSSTPTTCFDGPQSMDGTATVTANGGASPYTFIWSNGSTLQTPIGLAGAPLPLGINYSVLITDANGCTKSDLVIVESPEPITSTFGGSTVVTCFGGADGSLSGLNASGGDGGPYLYSINGSLPYVPSLPTYSALSAGIFTVQAKDGHGCLGTTTFTVSENPQINVNMSILNNPLCAGVDNGSFISQPSGGSTSNFDFLWSTGQNTIGNNFDILSSLSSGTYSVTVTDGSGCIEDSTLTLEAQTVLDLSFSTTDVSCNGGANGSATVTLNNSLGTPSSYAWSSGGFGATETGLIAAQYTVTVTDNVGCQVSDDVLIIEPNDNLSISIIGNNLACYNDSSGSAIVAFNAFGAGGWQYEWTKFPSTTIFATTQQVTGLGAGQYTVEVKDIANCIQSETIIITEPAELLTISTTSDISCFGDANGAIITTTSGGTTPYVHSWMGPSTYTSILESISNLGPGNYDLDVTDVNGCLISSSHTIFEPAVLDAVTLVSNVSCNGGTDASLEITVAGGVLPYTASYNSLLPTTISSGTLFEFANLPAGQGNFTILDYNNCSLSADVIITQPNLLEIISLSAQNPSCFNVIDGSAIIEVIGGVEPYEFLDLSGNIIDLTTLPPGITDVVVVDNNLCQETISFTLIEPLEILISGQICLNSATITVDNALGNYATTWTNESGEVIGTTNSVTDLNSELYTVLIIDQPNGCVQTATFDVTVPEMNVINASCSNISDGIIEILINGSSFYDVYVDGIQIAEDVVSANASNLGVGVHDIRIVDNGNCEYNAIATIGYDGGYSCLVPPIIISPNSDGSNDTWMPAIDVNEDISVTIYNRWGQIEFIATDANSLTFEWDGTRTNGTILPTTDYYFVIEFINNTAADKTGVITLIR